ncbi:MAG TPA: Asp23/Gls24 family envelope stress response protein [Acidimicrobiia bacterium]|nr:Asp23/Gls24 family envelope stress response protein [Acidimicrobiia bacterium]
MAQSESATTTKARSGDAQNKSELQTEHGTTTVADSVVAKIAGIAAREVSGVHAMGTGAARAFGALKEMLPIGSDEPAPTQGVMVEVGEKEAAVDLDLVVEYGVSIPELAKAVRNNVIQRVQRMTGLTVTEVNIAVDDIWLGDDTKDEEEPARVK